MNFKSLIGEPIDPKTAARKVEFYASAGQGTLLDYGMADNVTSVDARVALAMLKHKVAGGTEPVISDFADATSETVTGL